MKKAKPFFAVILLFIFASPFFIFSQENTSKPRIAVKKLTLSDKENIQLEVISDRVTDSTKLLIKFMKEYDLVDEDISSLPENTASMTDYCNNNNVDNIVFGKTFMAEDNSFIIEMSVFSREKGQTALTRIGKAETALDIFEAADSLTASIIEEFSGVHIAFGKIHLMKTGVEGSYIPYVDGEPFAENSSTIENLLIGKRTVEIRQQRMTGEALIKRSDVVVEENSTSEITFEIPHLLPEEAEVISDYDKIIEKNYDRIRQKDKVARAFNELDSLLSDTPYNTSLSQLREEYRIKRSEWELQLSEIGKREKREFIVGASLGVNLGMISKNNNGDSSENADPIDENEWNKTNELSPVAGINIQYQIYNSLYLQTEMNYKEIYFSNIDNYDNYVKMIEIPVLIKLTKQLGIHRFSMYMGPAYYSIHDQGGIFNYDYDTGSFNHVEINKEGMEMIAGVEYALKKGRHLLSAGLRLTTMDLADYSYTDPGNGDTYDSSLSGSTAEIILGYGYNLGGSGRIETEENRNKWMFPASAGFMFQMGESENNTDFVVFGGALKRINENYYAGLKLFAFQEGAAPLISIAYSKNPDKRIDNYSLIVVPMMGEVIYAVEYSIGIKRISFGLFSGGPIRAGSGLSDAAVGFSLGYFY